MAQNRVRRQTEAALLGMIADFGDCDVVSRVNKNPLAPQITTVTVDTAANDTQYTITINGIDVTITSDSDAEKDEIRDAFIAAIQDEPLLSKDVIPEVGASDTFTVTSAYPGQSFTLTESDGNLSTTATQAASEADEIEFGLGVMDDGLGVRNEIAASNAGNFDGGGQKAKLLEATELTAGEVEVTVPYIGSAVYSFSVTVAGDTHEVAVVADTDQDTTVAAIVTALNDQLPANTVVADDDGTGASSEVILTAELAGLPFDVGFGVSDEGASNPDLTINADNRGALTDVNKAFLGISAYTTEYEYPRDGADGDSKIKPNSSFSVLKEGRVWVEPEDSPTQGDEVWIRLEADGSLDQNGRFRASSGTGAVKLESARWVGTSGDLALLELTG